MADKLEISNINKFDGQNYVQWKFQMKCALKAKGIFNIVDGSTAKPPAEKSEELQSWNKKDALAMFTLTAGMDLNQITLVENCESSQEILVKLDSIYLQKSETNKMLVHERFHSYKMNPNDSIAQHIAKVENLAKMVKESGDTISEAAVMTKILSTLPSKYRNVRQAWLSLDETRQTISNLTARLLDEENNLSTIEETEVALATLSVKDKEESNKKNPKYQSGYKENIKRRIVCYNCHKRGHISRNCRAPKKNQGHENNTQRRNENMLTECSGTAFNVEYLSNQVTKEDTWIMDSGASAHMTYRKDFFSTLENFQSEVILSNNKTLKVQGKGTINIQKQVENEWQDATIQNVLYIPELKKNLFSEGVVTTKGMKVVKEGDQAVIYNNNKKVAVAVRDENNIYRMLFRTKCLNVNLVKTDSLKTWHERLGHINVNAIREMISQGLIICENLSDIDKFVCEGCLYGKQHKLPYKKSEHFKMKLGERIFSDVCGPMNTPSVQGAKYFISFKDECSGYRTVYFVKHKSDALDSFKDFNAKVKNKFGYGVKILHTDNGCEYTNTDFINYLKKEGISSERTAPYTPQQNGRVERDNRTIVESARSMLYAASVPKYLWAEAVNTAVYILNRTPTSQAPGSTPFEMWTSMKPSLGHAKIFGCEAYMHIPVEKRTKLEPKSKKLLFVGYDKNSTNYRLFDPVSKKIVISRNVTFNEQHKTYTAHPNFTSVDIVDGYDTCSDETQLACEDQNNQAQDNFDEEMGHDEEMGDSQESLPALRPQRQIKIPSRYNEYQLNFVETDIPLSYEEALESRDSDKWQNAISEELKALKDNDTWELMSLPPNKKAIGSKWVFRIKRDKDGLISRYKARLCAKGFAQKEGIDYTEIFSPTTRYDSIRVLLSIAAQNDLQIMQFDVKTAFLYGELQEDIFMEIPKGAIKESPDNNIVCKLNKSLYGLKQAPRCWNKKFNIFLTSHGFKQSEADKCIYTGFVGNEKLFLALYVDDGLILCKNKCTIINVLKEMESTFKIKFDDASYFVGLEITKFQNGIFISQQMYTKQIIERFNMTSATPVSTPEDTHQNLTANTGSDTEQFLQEGEVPYRQAIGSLMFLTTVSRPDIAHAVGVLSRYVNKHTKTHWNAIKRVIRYLIGTQNYGIFYSKENDLTLIGFSDADYASDIETRKSTSGYTFKIANGAVTWSSRRQQSVSLSTTEAEYIAASDAVKEALWLKQLLRDIGEKCESETTLFIDNQSAIRLIKNPELHSRTKHISVRYHFIREKYENGEITPKYIPSLEQEADIFTKALPKSQFQKLRTKLGLKEMYF